MAVRLLLNTRDSMDQTIFTVPFASMVDIVRETISIIARQSVCELGLSPIFPLEMSRDGRTQTHVVFQDIGEVKSCARRYRAFLYLLPWSIDLSDWNRIAFEWKSRIEYQVDWDHYSTEIVFATVREGSAHGLESCWFFVCSTSFDVQRWLHPNIADGRTRLVLTHEKASGYTPRSMSYELLVDFCAQFDVGRILETDWTTKTRLDFFYF